VSAGRDLLSLIDQLQRALAPAAGEEADPLWALVLELEAALASDRGKTQTERQLMAEIKAGVSFILEGRKSGRSGPDLAGPPLEALRRHVEHRIG